MEAAPEAIYKREDGMVVIDPAKAAGDKTIVDSCPYGVIYWNEDLDLPQKCTFCAHLLDEGWKEPRCAEMCPAGALTFGDLEDPKSEVAQSAAANSTEVLHPEYGMKEGVIYINLPKKFIAGTVAYEDSGDCAPGVAVTARTAGWEQTVETDGFGDFEFEGLADNQDYIVTLTADGYRPRQLSVKTSRDTHLGVIALEKGR